MRAIKEARKYIERNPADAAAQTLSRLVLALESEADFRIADIYQLDYDRFRLAIDILQEWRLDRHYAGKSRLFDVSMQVHGSAQGDETLGPTAGSVTGKGKGKGANKPAKN